MARRILILVVFLISGFSMPAWAEQAFTIEDIRVDGLQRMSAGTVFNYLPVKVGDRFDDQESSEVIRALFQTGFFQDVSVEREGNVLVIFVRERQAVASIDISGNKDIETEPLLDSLKQIGLAEGRVFNRSLLEKVEQELRRQYFGGGKYGVVIETTVTPLERNRVAIKIDIKEGEVARIRQINIIGNKEFSDKVLLDTMALSTPNWLSFYTKDDQYSKQKLSGDLETLRSFYLDQGYINFSIDSTQVSITPDKQHIYVTINVTEDRQYRVREVKLSGDLVVKPEELFPLISVRRDDLFSRKKITRTVDDIGSRLSDEGYAFANVNTIPDVDEENQTVSITFFVDPGKRVYVRRVNMAGNSRTRDEVLRREIRQMEGGWFSGKDVQRSRTRMERLGYFEEVNVETPTVPGTPDQVDVDFSVTERPSGNLVFGVGFAQSSGLLLNASISQNNFLGSGKRVDVSFNNSDINTVYSFNFVNPYYTIDGVSRGFGFSFRETDASEANLADYTTDTYGAHLNYGLPLSEHDTIRAQFEFENLSLGTTTFSPIEVREFIRDHGNDFNSVKFSGTWSHDTRNRTLFADRGTLQRLRAEVAIPGLDLEYFKINYKGLIYIPLTRSLTLSFNGELGYGDGLGDYDELPFFENYYAGGVRSVRGFEDNTLGPRDSNNNPLGGSFKVVGNAELIFPTPFAALSKSFRLSAFVDAGNVFDGVDNFDSDEVRVSTGLAALWLSPFGALQFSLAQPVKSEDNDDEQIFQFTLGTGF